MLIDQANMLEKTTKHIRSIKDEHTKNNSKFSSFYSNIESMDLNHAQDLRVKAQNLIAFVKKNLNGHTTKMRDLANKI